MPKRQQHKQSFVSNEEIGVLVTLLAVMINTKLVLDKLINTIRRCIRQISINLVSIKKNNLTLILIQQDSSITSRMVLIITVLVQLFLLYESQQLTVTRIPCIKLIRSMHVASLVQEVALSQVRSRLKIKFKLNMGKLIWVQKRRCTVSPLGARGTTSLI